MEEGPRGLQGDLALSRRVTQSISNPPGLQDRSPGDVWTVGGSWAGIGRMAGSRGWWASRTTLRTGGSAHFLLQAPRGRTPWSRPGPAQCPGQAGPLPLAFGTWPEALGLCQGRARRAEPAPPTDTARGSLGGDRLY